MIDHMPASSHYRRNISVNFLGQSERPPAGWGWSYVNHTVGTVTSMPLIGSALLDGLVLLQGHNIEVFCGELGLSGGAVIVFA